MFDVSTFVWALQGFVFARLNIHAEVMPPMVELVLGNMLEHGNDDVTSSMMATNIFDIWINWTNMWHLNILQVKSLSLVTHSQKSNPEQIMVQLGPDSFGLGLWLGLVGGFW